MPRSAMRRSVEEPESLKIKALRGGNVSEVSRFLSDLETAYNSLYSFDVWLALAAHYPRRYEPFIFGPYIAAAAAPRYAQWRSDEIPPDNRIELRRVSISSPGLWEFIGSLNPLQQLREYLKDRDERRKDREYREDAEKTRLSLDNELLRTKVLREQLDLLKDLPVDETLLNQIIWARLGPSLSRLGEHQDSGLIEGPMD